MVFRRGFTLWLRHMLRGFLSSGFGIVVWLKSAKGLLGHTHEWAVDVWVWVWWCVNGMLVWSYCG